MVKRNYAPRYVKRINRFVGKMFNQPPPTLGQLASGVSKAISIATKIATAVNSEKKYYDDAYVPTGVPTATPIVRLVTAIGGGTTVNSRIGNSISLNKIVSKHVINWNNPALATGAVILRHMYLIDRNDNASTAPTIAQILQNTGTPLLTIYSPMNMENKERFKVLKDDLLFMDVQKQMIETKWLHRFNLKKDIKGNRTEAHHVTWSSGTSTATQRGHIYEVWASYSVGTGVNDPSVGGYNRVRYYDN